MGKMRVKLAAQVFSRTFAAFMRFCKKNAGNYLLVFKSEKYIARQNKKISNAICPLKKKKIEAQM